MKKLLISLTILATLVSALPISSTSHTTHRAFTADLQEFWRSAQINESTPLAFDLQSQDELKIPLPNPKVQRLHWKSGSDSLTAHPFLGLEYRKQSVFKDLTQAWDGGVQLEGNKGPLAFWADARIFTEFHKIKNATSYDGDFIETQVEGQNGIDNTYLSYARYRGALELSGDYGHLGFRRDAFSWGPATFYNLSFFGEAIPFSHVYYQGALGPIRVMSLWGRLAIATPGEFPSEKTRSIYGHRYEWNFLKDWTVGLSEQLITYESEAFAALFPITPLFMEKGQGAEADNNGNLTVDLSYRWPKHALFYGEFFLDDLQEPTSLFNSFWGNRWAALLGTRWTGQVESYRWSGVLEWARVEPWVYAHYYGNTAQTSNRSQPLGNPLGPNSMGLKSQISLTADGFWDMRLGSELIWKGVDRGSHVEDPIRVPYEPSTKVFLDGVYSSPKLFLSPEIGLNWKFTRTDLGLKWGDDQLDWNFRTMWAY